MLLAIYLASTMCAGASLLMCRARPSGSVHEADTVHKWTHLQSLGGLHSHAR